MKFKNSIYLILILLIPRLSPAQVYKWEDAKGNVHYSSKKPSDDAQPAILPELKKQKSTPKAPALISCVEHGGIDCTKGADKDGSVVCRDGFAEASARFIFSCSAPKLEITEVSDTGSNGAFNVFVRNLTSVPARDVVVTLRSIEGKSVKGDGPAKIDSLGLESYFFSTSLPAGAKPAASNFVVRCGNCN
jgi:hypothetical protein